MGIEVGCNKMIQSKLNEFITQEKMGDYIRMQSNFPQMNFENVLLLLGQMPTATLVCGKNAWKKYHSFIGDKKAIALFGLEPAVVQYEETDSFEDMDISQSLEYKTVAVYDVSQLQEKGDIPPFLISNPIPIEDLLKEKYGLVIMTDADGQNIPNKIFKGFYNRSENTVYFRAGITENQRIEFLLRHYIKTHIEKEEITQYLNEMEDFLMFVLKNSFKEFDFIKESYYLSDFYDASEEDKRRFLQILSHLTLKIISEITLKNLLSFSETILCNHFFKTEDMSDVLAEIAAASELCNNEDIRYELLQFYERVSSMSEETYLTIYNQRKKQILFTFPPTNIY